MEKLGKSRCKHFYCWFQHVTRVGKSYSTTLTCIRQRTTNRRGQKPLGLRLVVVCFSKCSTAFQVSPLPFRLPGTDTTSAVSHHLSQLERQWLIRIGSLGKGRGTCTGIILVCPQGLLSYFACNKRMPEDLYSLYIDYVYIYIHINAYAQLYAKCDIYIYTVILLQTCCSFKGISVLLSPVVSSFWNIICPTNINTIIYSRACYAERRLLCGAAGSTNQ